VVEKAEVASFVVAASVVAVVVASKSVEAMAEQLVLL